MKKHLVNYGIATIFTLFSRIAFAATVTADIPVTAEIVDTCTVSASTLAFGNYVSTSDSDAEATITVTCTNGTTYHVALGAGTGSGATTGARKMTGTTPTHLLNYFLYSDNGRSINWGEAVGTDAVDGTGTGAAQILTVYGRIPAGQTAAFVDSHSDSVPVTVTFP